MRRASVAQMTALAKAPRAQPNTAAFVDDGDADADVDVDTADDVTNDSGTLEVNGKANGKGNGNDWSESQWPNAGGSESAAQHLSAAEQSHSRRLMLEKLERERAALATEKKRVAAATARLLEFEASVLVRVRQAELQSAERLGTVEKAAQKRISEAERAATQRCTRETEEARKQTAAAMAKVQADRGILEGDWARVRAAAAQQDVLFKQRLSELQLASRALVRLQQQQLLDRRRIAKQRMQLDLALQQLNMYHQVGGVGGGSASMKGTGGVGTLSGMPTATSGS